MVEARKSKTPKSRQINVAMFGPSEVGKTTFLAALGRDAGAEQSQITRFFAGNVHLSPGADLRALYAMNAATPQPTVRFGTYDYDVKHTCAANEVVLSFSINDCRGEQVSDYKQFNSSKELTGALYDARAILFFLPLHTNLWVSSDSGKAPSLWNKAISMARNVRNPYAFFMANFAL